MKSRVAWFLGDYTLELYWPYIMHRVGKDSDEYGRTQVGVQIQTQILYIRPRDDWSWSRSLAVRVFGFGFGVAYQHCDNPNMKNRSPKR